MFSEAPLEIIHETQAGKSGPHQQTPINPHADTHSHALLGAV